MHTCRCYKSQAFYLCVTSHDEQLLVPVLYKLFLCRVIIQV